MDISRESLRKRSSISLAAMNPARPWNESLTPLASDQSKDSLRKRPSVSVTAVNKADDESLSDAVVSPRLSIWQRYFCRPIVLASSARATTTWVDAQSTEVNLAPTTSTRYFSFLAVGSVVSLVFVGMLLGGVLALALALTLGRNSQYHNGTVQTVTPTTSINLHASSSGVLSSEASSTGVPPIVSNESRHSMTSQTMFHTFSPASSLTTSVVPKATPAGSAAATSTVNPTSSASADLQAFSISEAPIRLAVLANFPDPSIYWSSTDSLWYAFGTNDGAGILQANPSSEILNGANLQLATSPDFESWTLLPAAADPLPTPGAWARAGTGIIAASATKPLPYANVWCPDVLYNPDTSSFILYYSALSSSASVHCIGAATASTIRGPYTPLASALACPLSLGGAIDPAGFIEPTDGSFHVVYKVDGNSRGNGGECGNTVAPQVDTPLVLQTMLKDGITPDPAIAPITLLSRSAEDGPLVEAPGLVKVASVYYLFYSSGCTRSSDYTVRYATATSLTGPYTRASQTLLATGSHNLTAPGSVSVRYANASSVGQASSSETSGWTIALHGRTFTAEGGVRAMFTSGLEFNTAKRSVRLVEAGVVA